MSALARVRLHILAALLLVALAVLAVSIPRWWWTVGLAALAFGVNILGAESARQRANQEASRAEMNRLLGYQQPDP